MNVSKTKIMSNIYALLDPLVGENFAFEIVDEYLPGTYGPAR